MKREFFAGLLVIFAISIYFEYSRNHTMEVLLPQAVTTRVLSRNLQPLLQLGELARTSDFEVNANKALLTNNY